MLLNEYKEYLLTAARSDNKMSKNMSTHKDIYIIWPLAELSDTIHSPHTHTLYKKVSVIL